MVRALPPPQDRERDGLLAGRLERASESSHDVLFRAILAGIRDFNSVFAQDYTAATKVELRAKEGKAFLDRWMIGYLQCT
jgi:hypothetical protein